MEFSLVTAHGFHTRIVLEERLLSHGSLVFFIASLILLAVLFNGGVRHGDPRRGCLGGLRADAVGGRLGVVFLPWYERLIRGINFSY